MSALASGSRHPTSSGAGPATRARHPAFVTTHWSVVLTAGRQDSDRAQAALSELCRMYWYPLYAYVRQRGYSPEDSQDLTQEFFKRLLEKNALGSVSRCKGRFRSYLLTALNHFITDEWRRAHAQKRDAGLLIRLDEEAETRFRNEPADKVTPEKLFNQSWALSLLNRVFEKLDTEYRASGRAALFDALKFSLTGDRSSVPYSQLAKHLQLSENAVKLTVHRLRRRYRELLREEVANTVSSKDEIEPELRALFQALAG